MFKVALFRVLSLVLVSLTGFTSSGQIVSITDHGSTLKQIIIFGHHGVRSAAFPLSALAAYATRHHPQADLKAVLLPRQLHSAL